MASCQLHVHIKNLQCSGGKILHELFLPINLIPTTGFVTQRCLPLQESALSCPHVACKNLGYCFCTLFSFRISTNFAGPMEAE